MQYSIEVPELVDLEFPTGDVRMQVDLDVLTGEYSAVEIEGFRNAFVYAEAKAAVIAEHTYSLAKFTGSQSSEERDTWPEQQRWAELYISMDTSNQEWANVKVLLENMVTEEERIPLGGGDIAKYMADKVMANVGFFRLLISEASRAKRDAFSILDSIKSDRAAMKRFISTLEVTKAAREQDFVQKAYGK